MNDHKPSLEVPSTRLTEKQTHKQNQDQLNRDAGYHVVQRSTFASVVIVIVVALSMVINTGNSTAVSISLPTVGRYFSADESMMQWVVSAYPLSSGCLLLICGRLADLYGRKKGFLIGTFVMAVFTLACGFANSINTLVVLRAIQGIGAAATIPSSLGILAHSFPPSKARSWAFAAFGAGAPIGAAFGSVMGGVLTEKTAATWRSSFFLFAGINCLCFIGGLLCIDKDDTSSVPSTEKKVDWLGAFLITAGLVLIMFVLGEGETTGWATAYIIVLLILGVLLSGVFVYWQWYLEKAQEGNSVSTRVSSDGSTDNGIREEEQVEHRHEYGGDKEKATEDVTSRENFKTRLPPPLMKLSLWARANYRFAAMLIVAFTTWCSFIGWTFWVQLYYQNYLQLSPLSTVVRLVPMNVAGLLITIFVGFMAGHMPMIVITTLGSMGTAVACLLFAIIDPHVTYWAYGFPSIVISVLGADLVFTSGTLYLAKIALPHEQSLSGALFLTMTQLGTSFGVTISTVVFNRVTTSLDLENGGDMIYSYRAAQWTTCAFGLVAAALSVLFFRGVGVPGHKRQKPTSSEQTSELGVASTTSH